MVALKDLFNRLGAGDLRVSCGLKAGPLAVMRRGHWRCLTDARKCQCSWLQTGRTGRLKAHSATCAAWLEASGCSPDQHAPAHSSLATWPPCPQSEGGFPDFDADVRSNYLFNSSIAGIDAADAILLVRRRGERGKGARQEQGVVCCGCMVPGG